MKNKIFYSILIFLLIFIITIPSFASYNIIDPILSNTTSTSAKGNTAFTGNTTNDSLYSNTVGYNTSYTTPSPSSAHLPETNLPNTTNSNFTYKIIGNEVTITSYLGNETEVTIPSEIEGKKVTTIGEWAFSPIKILSPNPNTRYITKIILPNTIQYIEGSAFNTCESLSSINLPDSLISIEYMGFANCNSLKEIEIPCNTSVCAISSCQRLEKVVYKSGVNTIYLVSDFPSLREVYIPSSVTQISMSNYSNTTVYVESGSYAEEYCKSMKINFVALNSGSQQQSQGGSQGSGSQQQSQSSSQSSGNQQQIQGSSQGSGSQRSSTSVKNQDSTTSPIMLPKTGLGFGIIISVILVSIFGIIANRKRNYYKGIK